MMALCIGKVPLIPLGKRSMLTSRHSVRPCGAESVFLGYCPVHLKDRGYSRCALCSAWRAPAERDNCAKPEGYGLRPMACAPRTGRRIVVTTDDGTEFEAHWCAFVEDHPPIEPAFYRRGPAMFEPIRGAVGWRELDPLDARAIGDEALRRRD